MVLPDGIVEAIIATVPYGGGWGQIRGYLDAGGDVNDVTANGKTILILFLTTNEMEEEEHAQFVRFLIERGADVIVADERRRKLRELAKAVLTLRTLSLRGRAAPVDPILKFIVNLPDGVAWNLISFWPPRRYPHWVPLRVRSQNSYY